MTLSLLISTSQDSQSETESRRPRDSEAPFHNPMGDLRSDDAPTTRQLTSGMADGNEAVFRLFYERYCDRLFRYLIVMTRGDESLSRELLQTTMLKVVRHIKPFDDEAILWSWLTQLARTAFIDVVRKRRREPPTVPFVPEVLSDLQVAPTAAAASPWHAALDESLGELDRDEREVIDLAYFESLPHQTIAARSDTTPKAVESKLSRIRQKLRKAILRKLKNETET